MTGLLKNPMAYLSTSFALFLVALPLISIGTTGGPRVLLWGGLAALCVAGLIPPVQRLVCGPKPSSDDEGAGEREPTERKEGER